MPYPQRLYQHPSAQGSRDWFPLQPGQLVPAAFDNQYPSAMHPAVGRLEGPQPPLAQQYSSTMHPAVGRQAQPPVAGMVPEQPLEQPLVGQPQPIVPAAYADQLPSTMHPAVGRLDQPRPAGGQYPGTMHPAVGRQTQAPPAPPHRMTIQNGTSVGLFDYNQQPGGGWTGTQQVNPADPEAKAFVDRGYQVEGVSPGRPGLGFGPLGNDQRTNLMWQAQLGLPMTGAAPADTDQSFQAFLMRNRIPAASEGQMSQAMDAWNRSRHIDNLDRQVGQKDNPQYKKEAEAADLLEIMTKELGRPPTPVELADRLSRKQEILQQVVGPGPGGGAAKGVGPTDRAVGAKSGPGPGVVVPPVAANPVAEAAELQKTFGRDLGMALANADGKTGKLIAKPEDIAALIARENQLRPGLVDANRAKLLSILNSRIDPAVLQDYLFPQRMDTVGSSLFNNPFMPWSFLFPSMYYNEQTRGTFGSHTPEDKTRAAMRELLGRSGKNLYDPQPLPAQ